jgi:membrane-associated phospholipid phosphatase
MLPHPNLFWFSVTRLGEAQILLPALLAVLAPMGVRQGTARTAAAWLLLVAVAASIATATKVAFIGYGIGHAPTDFTGVSGHAMFAAAVLPLIAIATAGARRPGPWLAGAYALALLIACSRVVVGSHSASEALAGTVLGTLASAVAITLAPRLQQALPWSLLAGVVAWVALTAAGAPPSPTHEWVTRLSLAVSGCRQPYTREMMRAGQTRLQTCGAISSHAHSTTVTPILSS